MLPALAGALLLFHFRPKIERTPWSSIVRPTAYGLAIAACGVLVLFFLRPGLPGSLLILFASGLGAGYQIAANAAFVSAAPDEQRSQAFGLAQGGMSLGQGVVMILAGAVADHYSPAWVIAVAGTVGAMVALVDRALALNPSFARGWHISGMLRLWAGQPDIAIKRVETSLRLSPRARTGWASFQIGAAHFVSVQNEYSLLHREPEQEVLPACERLGLAFLPYFPLASGLLTGKYARGAPAPRAA